MAILSTENTEKLNSMCPAAKAVELGTTILAAQTHLDVVDGRLTALETGVNTLEAAAALEFKATVLLTAEEAATGKVLLADTLVPAGKCPVIEGLQLATSDAWVGNAFVGLNITDTNDVPVTLASIAKAGLGASKALILGNSTIVAETPLISGGTVDKGLMIKADGAIDAVVGRIKIVIWGRFV